MNIRKISVLFLFMASCQAQEGFPDPARLAGLVDINNYANLSLTDLGGLTDLNDVGDVGREVGLGDVANNPTFVSWAQNGLQNWQIGLNINLNSITRNSKKNWITVAGVDCVASGVPSSEQGSSCDLGGAGSQNVIGICHINRSPLNGEIFQTSAIMLKDFLLNESFSEDQKRAVFIHEIGHCLGLRHSNFNNPVGRPPVPCGNIFNGNVTNCIMNETISNTGMGLTAHPNEVAAVRSAYSPIVQAPNGSVIVGGNTVNHEERFFTVSNGTAFRHHSFPEFYISGTIGNALSTGDPDQGPSVREIYIMYDNGTEEIHSIDSDGNHSIDYATGN